MLMIMVFNIVTGCGMLKHLNGYLKKQGLRSTNQREQILDLFIKAGKHVSAEELYAIVQKNYPGTGYATVYRTLKLLSEAGIAQERKFEDGYTRYEHASADDHHDHLICTRCGLIVEFENKQIEMLQQDVATQHRFVIQNHRLELYGLCKRCAHTNVRRKSK